VLGRRGRDSSPQAAVSKRQRRAHSAEPRTQHNSQLSTSNLISPHIVLQILEERDKWTRESLLSDMRIIVTETLRDATGLTGPTTHDTLTEGTILEIIRPLISSGKCFSN
jgi:hypothetical protein